MQQIYSRKDMFQFLEKRLTKTYARLKEDRELELEQNLLKTYIIESNLDSVFSMPQTEDYEVKIEQTQDNNLFLLQSKSKKKNSKGTFFIDTIHPRFWIFHTVGRSDFTDRFIEKLLSMTINGLDRPWLETQYLEHIAKKELFRGFTLRYKDVFAMEEEGVPIELLSMKLWGYKAPKVLEILRRDSEIKHSVALSGVGIKHSLNGEEEFVIEDITYQAKFTAKGSSLEGHFFIINRIVKDYEAKVAAIENNAIEYGRTGQGYRFSGQPISIILTKEIEDLEVFLNDLFSSKNPFRLWGIRKRIGKDYYKVAGVDLHTGHKLDFEVTPQWLRVYLPKGSCGNTILRLFTNIQHYYDSEAKLEGFEV